MTTLWTPPADWRDRTRIGQFVQFAESRTGRAFADYDALWRWSVDAPEEFWAGIWDHFNVHGEYEAVLADAAMPGACWFPGARINYARQLLDFRGVTAEDTAVIGVSQTRPQVTLTFAELIEQVARARNALVELGVRRGDRVVAYLPNIPETLVAFLATASLGAVWASCAPEFGARSVLDRFRQLAPTVLLTVSGYTYGSKAVDRRAEVAAIREGLPTTVASGCPTRGPGVTLSVQPQATVWTSSRSRSTIRCSCSSHRVRRVNPKRSCTGTAASCWSTSRTTR